MLSGLSSLQHLVADTDYSEDLTKWCAGLVGPAAARIGWELSASDSHQTKLLR